MRHKALRCSVIIAAGLFLAVFFGLAYKNTPETDAVKATDFNAGRIIDDAVFYNPDTMTVEQIQAHLDQYSAKCDMWGEQPIGYGRKINGVAVNPNISRREYARMMREAGRADYHDAPYVCISKYYENPTTHKTNFETNAVAEEGMISAAQIIYDAAHAYNINPQVLLVMLKKESYVWGDTWPLKNEYNTVMGYACPDNAPCDSAYFGFYNQVMKAAWQLNYYKEHIYSYGYYPYMTNNIYYSPNYSCGTKAVYLENIATTSLYIYTPYTPNDAALANYPGEAYCGSYGNRNFFMYFSEWFGSTYLINAIDMETPRYMVVTDDAKARNLSDGSTKTIEKDTVLYYTKKTSLGGVIYLRIDTDPDFYISINDLSDFEPKWEEMETPRYLKATEDTKVIDPVTKKEIGEAEAIKYYDERFVTPDYNLCLRDSSDDDNSCVLFNSMAEVESWDTNDMLYPRSLSVENYSDIVDPTKKENFEEDEEKDGQVYYFDKTITHPYYGLCLVSESLENACVPYEKTTEAIVDLETPRNLKVNKTTYKVDSRTGEYQEDFKLNTTIIRMFLKKTYARRNDYFGECYLTEYDVNLNTSNCIRADQLSESITDLETKIQKTVTRETYKKFISDGTDNIKYPLDQTITRYFVAKTYFRDEENNLTACYLTEYDVANKSNSCILESDLD